MAVLALALDIGVSTSSFTAVNSIVLHPLAFPHQEQVMTLWETVPKLRTERDAVAPANFLDWKEQSRAFEDLPGVVMLKMMQEKHIAWPQLTQSAMANLIALSELTLIAY